MLAGRLFCAMRHQAAPCLKGNEVVGAVKQCVVNTHFGHYLDWVCTQASQDIGQRYIGANSKHQLRRLLPMPPWSAVAFLMLS